MKLKITLSISILTITIFFLSCNSAKKDKIASVDAGKINFSEHIAPIIFKNCSPCHRLDGAGPFPLLTYNDVVKHSKTIQFVTETRFMPPWPADPNYSHFIGEKVLTDDEIGLIKLWVKNGTKEGDKSKMPIAPFYTTGSSFGKPDLVVKMKKPIFIKGDNKDFFITVKLPFEIAKDTFVHFVEFVPGQKKLVHHMNGSIVKYDYDAKKDVFEGDSYANTEIYSNPEVLKKIKIFNDNGTYPLISPSVSNYLPGVDATVYPQDIGGFRLKRKNAFLYNIHYAPTAKDCYDDSYFNIFYDDKPPVRNVMETQLGTLGISAVIPPLSVPPNTVKKFYSEAKIFNDISLLTVNPHMHLLGKSFLAYAVTPTNDTIKLIKINNWDFRWQYFYTFKKMVKIPGGSTIHAEGVYDNTANNPNNPFTPARTVAERNGSMRTTDEMFQFIISFLPYKAGDENISLENSKYIKPAQK
jgi:hypothetical protein